jgi:hypothetical protein
MNNMAGIFQMLQSALQNPGPMLSRMGIPQSALNNPQQAVQDLLNSGRMSQQQFNQLRQTAQQFQNQFNMK